MSEKKDETLSRLEEEGEVAADYLEELLDIADNSPQSPIQCCSST